ncbi:MAG: hypothetical protein HS113_30530 [Verrucomicrobiales bacterium]|nr:hypothetical protein [Verrucomicrobiales bacterium]
MSLFRYDSWVCRLFSLVLFAAPTCCQSISVVRKGENGVYPRFSLQDFADLTLLASKLTNPTRPLDIWLAARLSAETQAALAGYVGPASDPTPLQRALVQDLNAVLREPTLHVPQRFEGITLRSDTQDLLSTDPRDEDLVRLNRWLLEDAYPRELARSQSGVWIEGTVPSNSRCRFQASDNLNLWVDVADEVWGQFRHRCAPGGGTKRFFRLTPWTPPAPPIRLVLLGDSTVMDGCGWGPGLSAYFKPTVQVINLAWPAHSTKVFLASEQRTRMVVIRPEFVLLQFGAVDALGGLDPEHDKTTLEEYAINLETLIQIIRDFDGTPVLVTPIVRRNFDASGRVLPLFQDRCAVMKNVAVRLGTPLIDLNQLSMNLFNELGESGSAYLSWRDRVHFSPEGAQVIAGLVASALPAPLGAYLLGESFEPSGQ